MKFFGRFPRRAAWLALLIILAACNSAGQALSTSDPAGSTTEYPSFEAGDCTLQFQGVQLSDRYPIGCTPGAKNCMQMDNGEQLLLVFFTPQGSCNLEALADKVAFEKEIYLLALDGKRSERLIAGVEGGVFALGFSLASPPSNLLLIWGNNPQIKLPAVKQ